MDATAPPDLAKRSSRSVTEDADRLRLRTKRVLLIRHGLPHEGHDRRPADPPLHPAGRAHAARLARRLARESVDLVVSSPQQRAIDTARPLARLLGMTPVVHAGLSEVDHGVERYRSAETLRREEPHRFAEFAASPARFFGKDPEYFRRDVVAAFEAVLASDAGCVVVFCHGMTIKTILCAVLGIDGGYVRFRIDHCSVTRLSGSEVSRMKLESLNESLCKPSRLSSHMPPETTGYGLC